jgi:fatty acid desaturase
MWGGTRRPPVRRAAAVAYARRGARPAPQAPRYRRPTPDHPLGPPSSRPSPAPPCSYPFYLLRRSPGKSGSHYDPKCDLFVPSEANMVLTSNAFLLAMAGVLAACTAKLGALAMFNLYFVPYWVFVAWLDAVTYLQHHGSSDPAEKLPWYR